MHSWPEQRRFTGENLFFSVYEEDSFPDDDSLAAAVANTDLASRTWYEHGEEGWFTYDGQDFTQMVWKDTCHLGCGHTRHFVVCRYSPSGNYIGEFDDNVMPPIV